MAEYVSTNRVRPPWTDAQVRQLAAWQASTVAPPWTCEVPGHGQLVPDLDGWRCRHDDCTVDVPTWCWVYMLDPAALASVEAVGLGADEDTKWADYTARKRAHEGPKPAPVCPHCGGTLG